MDTDQLTEGLRGAAHELRVDEAVPLDAIHSRHRRLRRRRTVGVFTVAAVVVLVAGFSLARIRQPDTSTLRIASAPGSSSHSDGTPGDSGPGSGGSDQHVVPPNVTIPPGEAPVADHYFKAPALLRDRADSTADSGVVPLSLDHVVGLIGDETFLDAVAAKVSRSSEWVAHRIDAMLSDDTSRGAGVDVVAIGTDATTTVQLVNATSEVLVERANAMNAASLQGQFDALKRQSRILTAAIVRLQALVGADPSKQTELVGQQAQLAAIEKRLVAIEQAASKPRFVVALVAQAIEINQAGFQVRWHRAVERIAR